MWEFCENWADKGVLTADVNVGGLPIRVGISHALTRPHDEKAFWSQFWTRAITPFQLNGESYIFALDGLNHIGYIFRMEDYGRCWDEKNQKYNYGAGWKLLYGGFWGPESSINVTSFELDGHTYLFEVDNSDWAHIRRINDDPSTGWSNTYDGTWDSEYAAIVSFELDCHPYIFTHSNINDEGYIFRINDDPCTGWSHMYGDFWPTEHAAISTFELNGHPYIFTYSSASINAYIKRINDDPCTGWTTIYEGSMDIHSVVESFKLDGHPYLFGLLNTPPTLAFILRINDDPCTGWTLKFSDYWDPNEFPYSAVKSFEMNGHPYLFAKSSCCEWMECEFVGGVPVPLYPSNCDSCNQNLPGEAYLKRINDDPNTGWEDLLQLEDIKIIRDETVVDEVGPPAIMMGDFNIHADKNGIMNQIFRKAGAVDAYIEVHGTGAGGETVDLRNNKFHQRLCQDDPATPGNECDPYDQSVYTKGRIDYVYYKPSGAGLRIVPKEACVIRDWQYHSEDVNDQMDLSDHYPLLVKFEIFQGGCTARAKGDLNCDRLINFADYAILASAWMSGPNDISWDPACDISEPADDMIDMKDIDAFTQGWLTAPPVHNVTQDKWYEFIQTAITYAQDGDEIEVAPGTYYEAINFKNRAIRLYSSGGPEVTTIDANNGAYHVVKCVNGEGPGTVLEGFTITGGNADGPDAADKLGGGMYNYQSNPKVINCNFTGNSAQHAGGMYNDQSSPTVTNCTFGSNSATGFGGGMYNLTNSSPMVTNCTFSGNSAVDGGAMDNRAFRHPNLTNCTFSNNSVSEKGGGMENSNSNPTLTNCTFTGNTANYGGGMYNYDSSPPMTDCNFNGNEATENGGGVENYESNPTLTNCTFTGNTANYGGGMCNYDSSPPMTDCNFNGNGALVNGGGMHNDQSSPTVTNCIFNGNEATNYGGGMYNKWGSSTIRGCTFAGNTASDGGGIYNGTVSSPTVTDCIFSGNEATSDGGGIYVIGGEPHLTNCIFSGNSADKGGGIYRWNPAYLTNCTFQDNTASYGGGMYNYEEYTCWLTNCTFSGNGATSDGGGMYNDQSNPTVTDCTFGNNQATNGGGMCNDNSNPTVTNCNFSGNSASEVGGGMRNWISSPTVTNCNFTGNSAQHAGGMFNDNGSSLTVTNCTFGNNTATGIGMDNRVSSNPNVTNCIIWGNEPNEIYDYSASPIVTYSDIQGGWSGSGGNNIDADPCFVDTDNPDPNLWNLHLKPDSPCIDGGDNAVLPPDTADLDDDGDTTEQIPFDLDGGPRVWNGVVDMGAYEYLNPPPPISSGVNFEYLAIICANWLAGTEPEL